MCNVCYCEGQTYALETILIQPDMKEIEKENYLCTGMYCHENMFR
jgi:hypothetical protein